jgi:alginate O-acetyltransferase complex protein AlgI
LIFNSLIFFLFYAIVIAGFFGMRSWALRKAFLVLASFLFYASYRPAYVFILLILILFDYWAALRISETKPPAARKVFLICSLALNLGFLGYFKYTNFALESIASLAPWFGGQAHFTPLDIFLPIGISFHVFQSMSYVIDTYKGELRPTRSLLDFMLFVSFFPQLVAGPIVRGGEFLPQLEEPRRVSGQALGWAATLITIGMFEKIVLADAMLGPVADKVYQLATPRVGFIDAWCATLAFAGQIFFDFNGYSVCAVGAALGLGFHLPWNFRFPYAAIGFSDFWHRWHISLSRWIRDYVYIPLGGNRHGVAKTFRNVIVTMFLAGLWHGAAWHFVVWGLLHGLFLVLERGAQILRLWPGEGSALPAKIAAGALTFACVCIAWVFFRATSFDQAVVLLAQMFNPFDAARLLAGAERLTAVGVMAALVVTHVALRNKTIEEAIAAAGYPALAVLLALMLIAIVSAGGEARGFIYFQF